MSSLNPSPSTKRKSPSSIKTTKKVKRLKLKTKPPSLNKTDNTNTDTREKANIIIEKLNDKELTINHEIFNILIQFYYKKIIDNHYDLMQ